jgi:hypothetical protein
MECDGLAIDRPVRIAFDNLAITVSGFRATAFVADYGERFSHDIGLTTRRSHFAIVAGCIA